MSASPTGRLSSQMRSPSRMSPESRMATRQVASSLNMSPATASTAVVENPKIKELALIVAKLLVVHSELDESDPLRDAYFQVIQDRTKCLNDTYNELKHRSSSTHRTTEVTRATHLSDGSEVVDHEIFSDGKLVEHDHEVYQTPAQRLSRRSQSPPRTMMSPPRTSAMFSPPRTTMSPPRSMTRTTRVMSPRVSQADFDLRY